MYDFDRTCYLRPLNKKIYKKRQLKVMEARTMPSFVNCKMQLILDKKEIPMARYKDVNHEQIL